MYPFPARLRTLLDHHRIRANPLQDPLGKRFKSPYTSTGRYWIHAPTSTTISIPITLSQPVPSRTQPVSIDFFTQQFTIHETHFAARTHHSWEWGCTVPRT